MEYWMFMLLWFVVYIVCFGLIFAALPSADAIESGAGLGTLGGAGGIVLGLFALASVIPAIAVEVRRFHDQDKSGWFILLNLIPFIGGLIVLVMMFLDGTPGANRFGPDPKNRTDTNIFA